MELGGLDRGKYLALLKRHGVRRTWDALLSKLEEIGEESFSSLVCPIPYLCRLYESGLAEKDKDSKKSSGVYFTPEDIASLMADLLLEKGLPDAPLCDVGCGTGMLSIALGRAIEKDFTPPCHPIELHLYDVDRLALAIASRLLRALFPGLFDIQVHAGSFLSSRASLPGGSYVISNPPYSRSAGTVKTDGAGLAKDLYAGFLAKIVSGAERAVVISPQSFLVGGTFLSLRRHIVSRAHGEIFVFDNVPSGAFCFRKEGVFNTNSSNSVRAAISLFEKGAGLFRLTPLIRFHSYERARLFQKEVLRGFLGNRGQDLIRPAKLDRALEDFYFEEVIPSKTCVGDLLDDSRLDVPPLCLSTSARYFLTASSRDLKRGGKIMLRPRDEKARVLLYALLNSSYGFMVFRAWDGGINLSSSFIQSVPVPLGVSVTPEVESIVHRLIGKESQRLSYKKNAGVYQETVKFTEEERGFLDQALFPGIDFSSLTARSPFDE